MRIIFDNQQDGIFVGDILAIVLDTLLACNRQNQSVTCTLAE